MNVKYENRRERERLRIRKSRRLLLFTCKEDAGDAARLCASMPKGECEECKVHAVKKMCEKAQAAKK